MTGCAVNRRIAEFFRQLINDLVDLTIGVLMREVVKQGRLRGCVTRDQRTK